MRVGLGVVLALLALPLLGASSPTSRVDLFVIERNKNRNLVQYSVRLDAACAPVGDEPLECFWRMLGACSALNRNALETPVATSTPAVEPVENTTDRLLGLLPGGGPPDPQTEPDSAMRYGLLEEGPAATEDVGLFERSAYGIADQDCRADGVTVQLKALPARSVTIRAVYEGGRCRAEAFTRIAGAEARLSRVYVFADETKLLPSVEYVDLFGQAPDGRAVTERLSSD
jgi:hypothetical protein